jgi:hypothetical protein
MINLRVSLTQMTDQKWRTLTATVRNAVSQQVQAGNAWQNYETVTLVRKYYITGTRAQAFSKWFTLHQFSIMEALYMFMRWEYTTNILRWPYQQFHQHNLPRVQRIFITHAIIHLSRMFKLRKNISKTRSDYPWKSIAKYYELLLAKLVNSF